MENFFDFAPQAGLFCGVFLTFLILFSPMARFLKAGVALIVGTIILINLAYFSVKFSAAVDKVWEFYEWPGGFWDSVPYHWSFIIRLCKYFNSPLDFAVLISVFSIPLATMFVKNSLLDRYLRNNPITSFLIGLPLGLVALYASYGLILPYFIVIGILSIPFSPELPDSEEVIIEGKQVFRRTMNALFMLKLQLIPFRQNGIKIHEYLRIPKKFESRGIIILGAPGSGKSHLIKTHFLPQLRKRKDLLVIYDYKGEFTQAFGEEKDVLILSPLDSRSAIWDIAKDVLILSPLDSRSAIWDIAKDVNTEAKALEFAKMIVQRDDSHHDSIFDEWSMDLITACLIKLRHGLMSRTTKYFWRKT